MNTLMRKLALGSLVLLTAGGASAAVTVTYSHPEHYRDMPYAPTDREQVLKELTEHFERLGAKLPSGQELRVEVLDLDLAGRIEPNFRGREDVRIMRGGADWPHMHVRYSIESNGQVLRSGDDNISDMMYLDRLNRYSDGDTLRYEKRMIDDWFKKKIEVRVAGRAP